MWERRSPGRHGFGDVVLEDWEVEVLKKRADKLDIPLLGEMGDHTTFWGRYSPGLGVIGFDGENFYVRTHAEYVDEVERVLTLYFGFEVTKRV